VNLLKLSLLITAVALGGCSSVSGLLGGDRSAPSAQPQQIQANNNNQLALPPDLTLRAPGAQPSYDSASLAAPAPKRAAAPASTNLYEEGAAPASAPKVDVYEKYGISKLNPDGSKKDEGKLSAELRAAILAEKRKTNPNYGSIMNIGGLFKDQ
jgi:uncharacterized protein YceK